MEIKIYAYQAFHIYYFFYPYRMYELLFILISYYFLVTAPKYNNDNVTSFDSIRDMK